MGPPAADNGRSLRDLFQHPEQWKRTRGLVDVLFYADLNFKQFSDDELRSGFALMRSSGVRLGLEVGAVKEWGVTGEKTYAPEKPIWDRIRRLGGDIVAIALDEPLLCVRHMLKKPDDYAVQETADYIARVRHDFPDIRIGDIETYPSTPVTDHLWWIDALQKRLAERNVRGLDFYRLDVDWAEFTVLNNGSWRDVKRLEGECRSRKLPFSLIYWASDYPALKPRGMADDSTWYVSLLHQGYDYAIIDGAPDQVVIESWIGAPSRCLPETGEFTFTRSGLDFVSRFVGPRR